MFSVRENRCRRRLIADARGKGVLETNWDGSVSVRQDKGRSA